MNHEALWKEFCNINNIDENIEYDVWSFGDDAKMADELLDLVIKGKKFGTASSYDEYIFEDALDDIPKVGDYSIILNSKNEAICIIRDYDVYIRKFKEIPPFHAYSEGEGDRSLNYWRDVHNRFFKKYVDDFNEESLVICEKFNLEYVANKEETNDLIFIEPTMEYENELKTYREEMLNYDSSFDGCLSLKRHSDINDFVNNCIKFSNPNRELGENDARINVIMCFRRIDMKMIGCMQIHNVLNEQMENITGHIGYSVRPSERRKGYAKMMLSKALDFLSTFGIKEVYISCLPENIGSKKTILGNGGKYIDTVFLESDNVYLDRYVIKMGE